MPDMIERLTPREFQILELASQGQSDKQIASQLGIHFGTVSTYWNRMRTKLGASTRGEMIAKLVRHQVSPANSAEAPVEIRFLEFLSDGVVRWAPDLRVLFSNDSARAMGLVSFASPGLAEHIESVSYRKEPAGLRLEVGNECLEVFSYPERSADGFIQSVFSVFKKV